MKWAVVAGGSKGLGFSLAKALARREYNILLIARNPDDLVNAKNKLQAQFRIQVETLVSDLSLPESAETIYKHCETNGLDINILCNAAGLGGAKDFPDLSLDELRSMISTNLGSSVALSFLFLSLLKKSAPAYILNIGSMAGFAPIPIKSIYSSSKSALHFFSYSLRNLLKQYHISVTCACPGPLFTKPSIEAETIRQLGWFGKKMAVKPDEAGETIVRGMLKGKMIVVPGKLAKLISFLQRMAPNGFMARVLYSSKKN
jgi:short-subunit dehydrogenase